MNFPDPASRIAWRCGSWPAMRERPMAQTAAGTGDQNGPDAMPSWSRVTSLARYGNQPSDATAASG